MNKVKLNINKIVNYEFLYSIKAYITLKMHKNNFNLILILNGCIV